MLWPGYDPHQLARNIVPGQARSLDMATPGAIDTDRDLNPSIKGSMIWNPNPAVVLPNTAQVMRGLGGEYPFCVVLEHIMTNTARFTDIVLPSTAQLEYIDL